MILRRIADALRRQDWVTVLIEFVLVIAGVLIALQVNNWNEERHDRQLEQQYLERLFADLNGSVEDYIDALEWEEGRLASQHVVLRSLRAGELAEEDRSAFESGLVWAGIHNPQRRRWGTVEELFSTGNITLIRDVELRAQITALGGFYDRNNEIVRDSRDRIALLRAQLTQRYDIIRYDGHGDEEGRSELGYDFALLAADATFVRTFADLHMQSDTVVGFAFGSMRSIETLRDQLAVELGYDTADLTRIPEREDRPWRIPEDDTP